LSRYPVNFVLAAAPCPLHRQSFGRRQTKGNFFARMPTTITK